MSSPEFDSSHLQQHDAHRRITYRDPLTLAVVKHAHGLVDPPLPGLGRLRTIDRQHMAELVAVGEPVEERPGGGVGVQSGGEILWH